MAVEKAFESMETDCIVAMWTLPRSCWRNDCSKQARSSRALPLQRRRPIRHLPRFAQGSLGQLRISLEAAQGA